MTQEEKREARENKIFTIAFLSMFLKFSTSVIGYNVFNWAKENNVMKTAQQKTKEVKQKIISFTTQTSKLNNR